MENKSTFDIDLLMNILDSYDIKHISMHVTDYTKLYSLEHDKMLSIGFEPYTQRSLLQNGLYGVLRCGLTNCWVNRNIVPGCIRIYARIDYPKPKSEIGWSPDLPLQQFDRLMKLKAFW